MPGYGVPAPTFASAQVRRQVIDAVKGLKNLSIASIDSEALAALVKDLPRSLQWGVMISDGTLFITDERGQFEVSLGWLLGER